MKKLYSIIIVLMVITFTSVTAEENEVWWGSNYMPGNIIGGGTVSLEWEPFNGPDSIPAGGVEMGLGIAGQAELLLYKPVFGVISPVDFGVAAKARTGFFFRQYTNTSSDPWFPVGIAAMGTAHFGFKGFDFHFSDYNDTPNTFFGYLSRFDYFINLGLALDIIKENADASSIGLAGATGVNYFVKDNFMLSAGYTHWKGLNGVYIGGSYKIGKGQETKNISIDLDSYYYQIYLSQFYSIYWYSFYAGGFYFDDSGYKEGQGTEWRLSSTEDNDELIIAKALLKVNSDESRWWKIKFESGSDKIIYEFLIDKDYNLLKLRFIDEESGDIREYIASPKELEAYSTADMRSVEDYEYKDWKTETVTIKTDAGTFTADHLVYPEDETGVKYQWWISNEVPGKMIKYQWKDSEETMTGELVKISTGNKSELGGF